jgi:hypothetical protein
MLVMGVAYAGVMNILTQLKLSLIVLMMTWAYVVSMSMRLTLTTWLTVLIACMMRCVTANC